MSGKGRRTGPCTCCGKTGPQYGRLNLCSGCYTRWLDHGKPAVCPPPSRPDRTFTPEDREASRRIRTEARQGRIEDYMWLRNEQKLTREAAAAQVGISKGTAERYEREHRRQQQQVAA